MHLKCSNGSKQALHLKCALQAVLPKADTMVVWSDLHEGQGTTLPCPVKKALSALLPWGLSLIHI